MYDSHLFVKKLKVREVQSLLSWEALEPTGQTWEPSPLLSPSSASGCPAANLPVVYLGLDFLTSESTQSFSNTNVHTNNGWATCVCVGGGDFREEGVEEG